MAASLEGIVEDGGAGQRAAGEVRSDVAHVEVAHLLGPGLKADARERLHALASVERQPRCRVHPVAELVLGLRRTEAEIAKARQDADRMPDLRAQRLQS